MNTPSVLCLLALACSGCVTVSVVTIGTKTSLEKQLMGEFEPLSDEELLAASVRASPVQDTVAQDDAQAAALAARQRQMFNRDDVRALKTAGCLGEGLGAKLVVRPCEHPADAALLQRLAVEENTDRQAIVAWVLANDPALTGKDLGAVSAVYHRLLVEQSAQGDWLQRDDGTWQQP